MYKIKIESYTNSGPGRGNAPKEKHDDDSKNIGLIEDNLTYLFEGIDVRYSVESIKSKKDYATLVKNVRNRERPSEVFIIGSISDSNFFYKAGSDKPNEPPRSTYELPIVTMRFNSPDNNEYHCLLISHSNVYIMSEKGDTIDLLRL